MKQTCSHLKFPLPFYSLSLENVFPHHTCWCYICGPQEVWGDHQRQESWGSSIFWNRWLVSKPPFQLTSLDELILLPLVPRLPTRSTASFRYQGSNSRMGQRGICQLAVMSFVVNQTWIWIFVDKSLFSKVWLGEVFREELSDPGRIQTPVTTTPLVEDCLVMCFTEILK